MLGVQVIVVFGLFGAVILLFRISGHYSPLVTYVFAVAFLASVAAHLVWFRLKAPRAIVATDDFLGITTHGGEQQRISWSSVVLATHSTKQLGMQWELDLITSERIILRDVGIDSRRWGLLRAAIIELAAGNGASVTVDPLSKGFYS
jgi:hypothetical protein